MNYAGGEPVRLGDRVDLGGDAGEVVVIISDQAFTEAYPSEAWAYLGHGMLVNFEAYGLIYYPEPESDLSLVARAKP